MFSLRCVVLYSTSRYPIIEHTAGRVVYVLYRSKEGRLGIPACHRVLGQVNGALLCFLLGRLRVLRVVWFGLDYCRLEEPLLGADLLVVLGGWRPDVG